MIKLFKSKEKAKPLTPSAPLTLLPGSSGEHHLQEKYGTRQRALRFYDKQVLNYLSPVMKEFIAKQEILFIATADKHGECDCSFRFGKPGFVRVLNDNYLAYPEYRGNGVLASQGNIAENPHIGMILVDFFDSTVGLHINGKAKIVENEEFLKLKAELPDDIISEIHTEGRFRPERWLMVEVEEAYIHCSKHVPLLVKAEKDIYWGTDDDGLKRSDFFALNDISLYLRLGGAHAVQAIADTLALKLILDDKLKSSLQKASLHNLLNELKDFLSSVFGAEGFEPIQEEHIRNAFRQHIRPDLDECQLDRSIELLRETLLDLDVPEHETNRIIGDLRLPGAASKS